MPAAVSEAFVRDAYARATPDIAVLVTLSAEGLDEPLRVCSWPAPRAGTNRRGLESRGEVYDYFPFAFAWGGSSASEIARGAKLEIANTDGAISSAVRLATGRPMLDIEAVRVVAPDVIELAMLGAGLAEVEIDASHATGVLLPREFDTEPACAACYTASRMPAMF